MSDDSIAPVGPPDAAILRDPIQSSHSTSQGPTPTIPPWTADKSSLKQNFTVPSHLKPSGTAGPKLLQIERSHASFSSEALTTYLYGQPFLDRQAKLLNIIQNEEAFDKTRLNYQGRSERFRHALRKEKRFVQLAKEHQWDGEDTAMAEMLIDMPGPFSLHKSMFLKTLTEQGDDEQQELFTRRAEKFEIIGCYAQTELGHGSNVQGLETTAIYDPKTKEFVINSPYLTASKWWIGGLGRSADHAVVMAQLITNGVKYGPHPFVVPIRDMITREPLEGRTIGDIGPKLGYQTTDNGMLLFDHVRIPHNHLLSRFSRVDPDTGVYAKPQNAKLAYGTMTYIRAGIVQQARAVLARACTVAVRYCAIRRQFVDKDAPVMDGKKPAENQVLDYQMVQYRIFPILAQAFACHYTGKEMFRLYSESQKNMAEGDFSLLADVHASSSGLKSLTTIMAAQAIEECRRACGGHGFSQASGLGALYADYLPQVTWEGDSYMITQQTGRYLFKTMRTLYADRNAKLSPENVTGEYILRYLSNPEAKSPVTYSGDFHDVEAFVLAFGHRAAYLIAQATRKRDIERRTWNSLLVDIYRCSVAHCQFILVRNFAQAILHDPALKTNPALHQIVQVVFELFACHTMDIEASEFLASGYINPSQHTLLRNRVYALLAQIRPQAVALVDSLAIPDYLLNSELGRYDGNVYENLISFAAREPLNGVRFNVNPWDEELAIGEPKLSKL
ncbi:acyl-CoA dehydrogenase/oxidase C-terminal [Melampsora americana]|nr:acyl-CoA dehydrogenase/oxidase C-terminal [Melampsora americana]